MLADVEKICDRIAILARGELLNIGSLDDILGTQETYHATIRNGEIKDMEDWLTNITQENHIFRGELEGNPPRIY